MYVCQDAVELLARSLRRGLAVGQESHIAAVVAAAWQESTELPLRRVAAKHIGYVLDPACCLCTCYRTGRPGGFHAASESATSGARTAMLACVGDAHAVAAHIADERDSLVREYMERWDL